MPHRDDVDEVQNDPLPSNPQYEEPQRKLRFSGVKNQPRKSKPNIPKMDDIPEIKVSEPPDELVFTLSDFADEDDLEAVRRANQRYECNGKCEVQLLDHERS